MRLLLSLVFTLISALATAVIVPKAPDLDATAYILMDAQSGNTLVEKNSDDTLPPASLTKMLTSYIAVHEMQGGNATEDTPVPISIKAWKTGGSKMFIREGTQVPLIDLLRGIIIQSGNDASVAVAEYFAGSEEAFADLMNQYASDLGMTNSHFMNATGLPHESHYTSAKDLAVLSQHIILDHPEYYPLYSEKYFEFNKIRQPNRNKLLWRDPSVDGLKTGHTEEAGFCLAASAVREGTRLIAVVLGTRSKEARARETQKLLAYGFRYFETHQLYEAEQVLDTRKVWLGNGSELSVGLADSLHLTLPRGTQGELDVQLITDEYIKAPIQLGQAVGTLKVSKDGETIAEHRLVALTQVEEAGFFGRVFGSIQLFFARLFG